MKIKNVNLSNDPEIKTQPVFNEDNKDTIAKKQKKQFITDTSSMLKVTFEDDTALYLYAPKGYDYDGATIPFGIGKGNMKLLIPALFHDIMCDKKEIINYNRELSSKIFYECLVYCHVNKIIAGVMYLFVDNFQKFQDWGRK